MIRKHFRLKRIALGLAFAAFAAPSAQAMVAIDGPTGGEQAYQVQSLKASQLGPLDPWAYAAVHSQDATPASTVLTRTSTDNGFNWSDAGIGASVTFGGVLVLLTAVGFGRKYRGRIDRSGLATS
jgi:hypothetical protein